MITSRQPIITIKKWTNPATIIAMVTIPFCCVCAAKAFKRWKCRCDGIPAEIRVIYFVFPWRQTSTHTIAYVFVFSVVDNSAQTFAVIFLGLYTQRVTERQCIMNISGVWNRFSRQNERTPSTYSLCPTHTHTRARSERETQITEIHLNAISYL